MFLVVRSTTAVALTHSSHSLCVKYRRVPLEATRKSFLSAQDR